MTFVLIPGAGGVAAYWARVVSLLEKAGHRAIAVSLPGADEKRGLSDYADLVVAAIGTHSDVVLVAQSMGGFTAAMVCARASVRSLIFVNAMVPVPGESANEWGGHTGSDQARRAAAKRLGYSPEFSLETYFLHDLSEGARKAVMSEPGDEAELAFTEPCVFERWPDVPIRVIAGRDDRLFPVEFQARVARERLGKELEIIPGGHLVALSQPQALAALLLAQS